MPNKHFDVSVSTSIVIDPKTLRSDAEVTKWYMPVIDALISLGGEATKKDAVKQVIAMNGVTNEELQRKIKSGASALERTIEFARNDLRVEGIIDGSTRGIWKLTELGRNILISDELAGMIRQKSVKISAARGKNRKSNEHKPVPIVDLSPYYQFRSENHIFYEPSLETVKAEKDADDSLLDALQNVSLFINNNHSSAHTAKPKPVPILSQGRLMYPRNRTTAANALAHANFKCEIDANHPTFLRRQSDFQYTEPHHLIPMSYQDQFDVSLDVEENIVSLCCTCHKQVHYGADADAIINRLYDERKDSLFSAGIEVTKEQLSAMYK